MFNPRVSICAGACHKAAAGHIYCNAGICSISIRAHVQGISQLLLQFFGQYFPQILHRHVVFVVIQHLVAGNDKIQFMGQGVGDELAVAGRSVIAGIPSQIDVESVIQNDPLAAGQILRSRVIFLDPICREKIIFIVGEKSLQQDLFLTLHHHISDIECDCQQQHKPHDPEPVVVQDIADALPEMHGAEFCRLRCLPACKAFLDIHCIQPPAYSMPCFCIFLRCFRSRSACSHAACSSASSPVYFLKTVLIK